MTINPNTFWKIIKEIVKNESLIIDAIKKIRQKLKKKDSPESKLLEDGNIQATQAYEQKIDLCIKSLRQHVKVINRQSNVISEHSKIIEEITTQSENLAIQSKNLATLVNVLIWSLGVSFIVAVIAIFVAIFK